MDGQQFDINGLMSQLTPDKVQKLQDPAFRAQAAMHLAQQFPAPPPEVMQQLNPASGGAPGGAPASPTPQVPPQAGPQNPFQGLR